MPRHTSTIMTLLAMSLTAAVSTSALAQQGQGGEGGQGGAPSAQPSPPQRPAPPTRTPSSMTPSGWKKIPTTGGFGVPSRWNGIASRPYSTPAPSAPPAAMPNDTGSGLVRPGTGWAVPNGGGWSGMKPMGPTELPRPEGWDDRFGRDTSGIYINRGDGLKFYIRRWHNHGGYAYRPWARYYRIGSWHWYWQNWNDYQPVWYHGTGFDGNVQTGAWQPPEPEPAPAPKSTMELAADALKAGDADEAVRLFGQRIGQDDNDALAQRGLALALLEQKKLDKAIAVMSTTYAKYPWLASMPIDPGTLMGNATIHRNRFTTVMQRANDTKTSSSLLTAAILAQSEGRNDIARQLVDRAEAAGLERPVVEALRAATLN